jgi:hypothetical protein
MIFSVTHYLELRDPISIYCISPILPTNGYIVLLAWVSTLGEKHVMHDCSTAKTLD